jgi:galactokinase
VTERAFCAPGRVNLIGEHTDYNLGFVLPIALDLECVVTTSPSTDGRLRVYTETFRMSADWDPAEIRNLSPAHDWTDYVIGVARELIAAGYSVDPQSLRIRSTVPEGAGLSSSASLEVASALAMLGGRSIDKLELAKLCQRAERGFVGVPSGIMDQYVAVFGEQGAAIEVDCRSLTHKVVALPANVEILAVNTMVKHTLGQSAYKDRVRECAAAVEAIRARYPQVESLRDVDGPMLSEVEALIPEPPRRRAWHVVGENWRVQRFVQACAAGDLRVMGELFVGSHSSLRDAYEVSCEELDFLVDTAIAIEGVYGARMTGGGFGGCTVNLVDPGAVAKFETEITARYQRRFGVEPPIYRCRPSAGASEVLLLRG